MLAACEVDAASTIRMVGISHHANGGLRDRRLEGWTKMVNAVTVQVDAKGRVVLPLALRRRLKIEEGAILFVQESDGELRLRRAENPFDVLAEQAEAELRAGKTTSLRAHAAKHGIELDAE